MKDKNCFFSNYLKWLNRCFLYKRVFFFTTADLNLEPQMKQKLCVVGCGRGKGHQGLTFAVNHVGIEFETDLAETQEGAVGVDALAVEADVLFAALVHLCGDE